MTPNCCGDLVCAFPQQTCRHDPPQDGEPCSILIPCTRELRCINLVCREPRKVGEGCLVTSDCADGLDCRPCFASGCRTPFMCFPQAGAPITDEQTCLSLFSPLLQNETIKGNVTTSFGVGTSLSGGISGIDEAGTVYGQDGHYGCFVTTCLGGVLNAGVASFVAVGFYNSFDDFKGTAVAIVEGAGEGVSFSTSQILDLQGRLVGTEDAFSVEVSLLPITAGAYQCNAVVDTFASWGTTTSTTLAPGVTTKTATSTTSTTLRPISLESLATFLGRVLPDPAGETGRRRLVARKLARLERRAVNQIQKGLASRGSRQSTRYRRARRALTRLLATARRGSAKGTLSVPLGPIETLANALVLRLPRGGG